jgi:hypothetical protein
VDAQATVGDVEREQAQQEVSLYACQEHFSLFSWKKSFFLFPIPRRKKSF